MVSIGDISAFQIIFALLMALSLLGWILKKSLSTAFTSITNGKSDYAFAVLPLVYAAVAYVIEKITQIKECT